MGPNCPGPNLLILHVFEDLRRRKNPCCLVVSGYNYGGTGVGTRAGGGGKLRIYNGAQGERIRNKQGAKEEEGKHDIC